MVQIVEKQLARVGSTMADPTSACTDGGGENIGRAGLHNHLEGFGQGYVRRRCLAHISWRVCDAGLDEARELVRDYRALCRYLHEGKTWTRLQAIAILTVAEGGLAVMDRGSAAFVSLFSRAPPTIVEDRPETAQRFLRFLLGLWDSGTHHDRILRI